MIGCRSAAALLAVVLVLSGCTADGDEPAAERSAAATEPQAPGALAQGAVATRIEKPTPGGAGGFADAPPAGMTPAKAPVQAGPGFAGQALPTNQWWSSALTGPLTQPMWAHPLA
ncbi:MAG TPA: hypothetical protein VFO77_15520, partial [Actinoplanes sp.]|nr:hypothetical protein [Actinoplanes sp.]